MRRWDLKNAWKSVCMSGKQLIQMTASGTWRVLLTGLCVKVTHNDQRLYCVSYSRVLSWRPDAQKQQEFSLESLRFVYRALIWWEASYVQICAGLCRQMCCTITVNSSFRHTQDPIYTMFSCSCPNSSCARNKQEQSAWTLGHGGKHAQQQQAAAIILHRPQSKGKPSCYLR